MKRDIYVWEETYMYEKWPIWFSYVLRARATHWCTLCVWNCICMKRDLYVWKETYMYEKRPICMKRDISLSHTYHSHTYCVRARHTDAKSDLYVWKEMCMYEKRPICMKNGLSDSHTYCARARHFDALCMYEKRPIKETRMYEKRPVFVERDL